jgi:hypothetical protein
MEATFLILFGMAVGMALMPHVQRLVDRVRSRLDELDQLDRARGPSPWS